MNILMLCTKYPDRIEGSYLSSELADAWAAQGHKVTVVALQWEAKTGLATRRLDFPSGVTAHFFGPCHIAGFGRLVERLSRWVWSSVRARRQLRRIMRDQSFDCVMAFAPLSKNHW